MIYRNIKTGDYYEYRCTGIDTTNERDGLTVVIYSPLASPDTLYVRERVEFFSKFRSILEEPLYSEPPYSQES